MLLLPHVEQMRIYHLLERQSLVLNWMKSTYIFLLASKIYFQSELNDSAVPGCEDATKRARLPPNIWRAKIRVIESIEQFTPELEESILVDMYVLRD